MGEIKSEAATVAVPTIPEELWMLWAGRDWVPSVDDATGGRTLLVSFSEAEAINAAAHQENMWDVDCIPIRVK